MSNRTLELLETVESYITVSDEQPSNQEDFIERFGQGKKVDEGIFIVGEDIFAGKVLCFYYDEKPNTVFAFAEVDGEDPGNPRYYINEDTFLNRQIKFIPSLDGIPFAEECPNCDKEPEEYYGVLDGFRQGGYDWPAYLNCIGGYDGWSDYVSWDEVHCCTECNTKFAFESGN